MIPAYAYALPAAAALLFASFFWAQALPAVVSLGLIAVIALTAAGVGRLALGAFVRSPISESERTLIGCTIGLGILSQALFLLAVLHLFRPWAMGMLLAVAWVVGFTEMRAIVWSLRADRNLLQGRAGWSAGIAGLLALPLLFCLVPPHSYDALVYHLELPALYLNAGRLVSPERLVYAHFPQNAEMLFALGLGLGSDLLANMTSWLATALSVWWVFEIGKREMPLNAALFAAALVASHTAVMLLSSIAYVETLTMLWITAAVLCLVRWRELPEGDDGWVVLSGAFAGLAVGTKYTAGVAPAALAVYLLIKRRWRPSAYFCAASAVAGLPWLMKNAVMAGNPVFPFLYERFAPPASGWAAETARGYFQALTEYAPRRGRVLADLAALPLLMATAAPRFGGGADVLGRLGWPTLVLLTPAAIWAAARNAHLRLAAIYCAAHAAVWFLTGTVLRFLVVLVPLWAIVAAAGMERAWRALGPTPRRAAAAGLGLLALLQLALFLHVQALFGAWSPLLGVQSRDEYLAQKLRYYPCARWAGAHLPGNVRMLLVGEQRGYYLERDHAVTTVMAPNRFVGWADASADARELSERLRAEGGYTHLLVVPEEARRLAPYGTMDFTEKGRANWEALLASQAERLYDSGGCAVLALRP